MTALPKHREMRQARQHVRWRTSLKEARTTLLNSSGDCCYCNYAVFIAIS